MSFSWTRVGAILHKELRDYRRNRFVIGTMAATPVLFIILPAIQLLAANATGKDLSVHVGLSLLYLLVIPVMMPSAVSAYSVVGEREQGTLEPVLTTPIRREEFLIGKALAAFVPTLVIAYAVFGVFLAQKLNQKPLTIVGDGTQKRDFLYVTDVARAFYAAARTDRVQRIYNLGAGNPQTVNYLASLLGGPTIHLPKRPGEPDCTWADITRIRTEVGWSPQVSFEEGVRTMLQNIDYWREAPVWDVTSIEAATRNWFAFLAEKGSTA